MNKQWYIACISDPRSMKYLPIALRAVSKTSKVWIPTQLIMKKKRNSAAKQDSWQEIEVPLYKGYAFIQCEQNELCEVESVVKGSCRGWMLKRGEETQPQPLTEDEIKGLEKVALEHQNKKPELDQFNLSVGQDIEMTAGPFKGFTATVRGMKKHMVQAEVSIFGRSTNIEVSIEQCIPASK